MSRIELTDYPVCGELQLSSENDRLGNPAPSLDLPYPVPHEGSVHAPPASANHYCQTLGTG